MKTVMLRLDRIDVSGRLREIDPDYVALIAASIEDEGQLTPIEVREARADGMYPIVFGAHRHAAMTSLGRKEIAAIIFTGSDLKAQMREVDENLFRHDLNELDRCAFLARRKELYEQLHPEAARGGDRKSDQVGKNANLIGGIRFTADAGRKLGLSESMISRLVRRHMALAPDVRVRLVGTKIARTGSELDALAKLNPQQQRAALDLLQDWPGEYRTVAAAAQKVLGRAAPPVSVDEQQLRNLMGAWRKSGAKARDQFFDFLAETELPRLEAALRDRAARHAELDRKVKAGGKRGAKA